MKKPSFCVCGHGKKIHGSTGVCGADSKKSKTGFCECNCFEKRKKNK